MAVYISQNGLPLSVASSAKLPAGAYVGYTCLLEDVGALAVKTPSGYATLANNGALTAPSYATTSAFPSTHKKGRLLFCDADSSLYLDNGTAYKKVTSAQ